MKDKKETTHTAQELLDRAERDGSPVIEGGQATFVWRGQTPAVLSGDHDDWAGENDPQAKSGMSPIGPGLWAQRLRLRRDTYLEYGLFVDGRRVDDPLNRNRRTPNGLGNGNHIVEMPAAPADPFARAGARAVKGRITQHALTESHLLVGGSRKLWLYAPPTPRPVPLLIVLDGADYLKRGKVAAMVDSLIAAGEIPPVALAMVDCSRTARFIEYACGEIHLLLLRDEVLPLAAEHINLTKRRGAHGIMGASMGGVMALYAGLRMPETFGRVLSQSGAFSVSLDSGKEFDLAVYPLVRAGAAKQLNIWMDAGRYESLLATNRRMHRLLQRQGYAVTYQEYSGGHNFPSWRKELPQGLKALFG